jgi:hypothetical protein
MELNMEEQVRSLLLALFLLILPWVVLLIGLVFNLENVWFYLLCVTWFGCGVIFYGTMN